MSTTKSQTKILNGIIIKSYHISVDAESAGL